MNYLLQLIMGGILMPVPLQAKWTIGPSTTFWEVNLYDVLRHTVKLNVLNMGVIAHMIM